MISFADLSIDLGLTENQFRLILIFVVILIAVLFIARNIRRSRRAAKGLPTGRHGNASEQVQMDTLAYSSRMLSWAPLGKLFFALALIIVGLVTNSLIVPMITFCVGLALMAYSTNFKIPSLIALAIGEAMLIMIIGCGMISIMGNTNDVAIWDTNILWFHVHMTVASFNQAWLVFFRAIAGVTLMLAFATSTPIPHLAQALRQLRIPKEITEIVVLIYRYSFLLLERMQTMTSAADCRLGFSGFMRSMRTLAGMITGIFTSSMDIGDKAQNALDCRNYTGEFPVFRSPQKVSFKWVAIPVICAIALFFVGINSVGYLDMYQIFFGGV